MLAANRDFMSAAIDRELLEASLKGLSKRMNQLILQGADVNTANDHIRKVPKGYRPLDCALVSGKLTCVELLIQNYAIVDNDIQQRHLGNSSTLSLACSLGFYDAVKLLVEHNANVNGSVNAIPPLFAIFDRYDRHNLPFDEIGMAIVRYLVEKGADVHRTWLTQDKKPYIGTLPMRALNHAYNDFELLRFLIKNNVDLFIKNSLGDTVYDILAVRKSPEAERAKAIIKSMEFMDFSVEKSPSVDIVQQQEPSLNQEMHVVDLDNDIIEYVDLPKERLGEPIDLKSPIGSESLYGEADEMSMTDRIIEKSFFTSIKDASDTDLDQMLAATEMETEADTEIVDYVPKAFVELANIEDTISPVIEAIEKQPKKPKDIMRASLNDQLLIATAIGNSAVMNLLIDQGANVEAVATKNFSGVLKGETPLMCAVRYADKECIKTLVKRGADAKTLSVYLQAQGNA